MRPRKADIKAVTTGCPSVMGGPRYGTTASFLLSEPFSPFLPSRFARTRATSPGTPTTLNMSAGRLSGTVLSSTACPKASQPMEILRKGAPWLRPTACWPASWPWPSSRAWSLPWAWPKGRPFFYVVVGPASSVTREVAALDTFTSNVKTISSTFTRGTGVPYVMAGVVCLMFLSTKMATSVKVRNACLTAKGTVGAACAPLLPAGIKEKAVT